MSMIQPRRVYRSLRTSAVAFSVFTAALSTMAPSKAGAAPVGSMMDWTIHQHYLSTRALGMGNAFTAVADDTAALFYNPAGLARLKEGQMNFSLRAMVDPEVNKLVNDIDKASKSQDATAITDLLESNFGEHYSARVPTLSAEWVRPGWGIAIIPADLSVEMEIHNLAGASLDLVATNDTTIAYGRGWDVKWFEGHHISLGVTGKAIYRAFFNKAFLASELATDSKLLRAEDASEGFTFDIDFGMLWTPKMSETAWVRPTFGMTVRNVADYGFASNFHLIDPNSKKAPNLQRRLDVGTLVELPDWWIFKTRVAADVRDIGHEVWTFKKGTHLGAEFLWKVKSWWQGGWRVGVNQGYFTAGFTGLFGIFQMELATYGEEVGSSQNPKSDRRYMMKLALDF